MNFFDSLKAQIRLADPTLTAQEVSSYLPPLSQAPNRLVVYALVSGDRFPTLSTNYAPGATVSCRKRIQIANYALVQENAYNLHSKLLADLHGFAGLLGGVGGVNVLSFIAISGQERSGYIEASRRHWFIQDYDVMHQEVLP